MALPNVGDSGWGTTLNNWLLVGHTAAGANNAPNRKIITFNSAMGDEVSGTNIIADVGFTSTNIILIGAVTFNTSSKSSSSTGFDDATNHYCIYRDGTGGNHKTNSSYSICLAENGATVYHAGYISAISSSGFTVTWTKAGGVNTGTATLYALCLG